MRNNPREVADGVLFLRTMMANVYMVRTPTSWVLIDAGLRGYADAIRSAAQAFVGSSAHPAAIVLTHGHFDHVGSLEALLEEWPVPVFAHRLETPYLTGQSRYPPARPARRRRGPVTPLATVSSRAHRHLRSAGASPRRWCRPGAGGLALGAHARTCARPHLAVPGSRPRVDRWRRRHDRAAGVGDRGEHSTSGSARTARVLHVRLAVRGRVRRPPCRAAAGRSCRRPRRAPSRGGDARRASESRSALRRAGSPANRPLRATSRRHERARHCQPSTGSSSEACRRNCRSRRSRMHHGRAAQANDLTRTGLGIHSSRGGFHEVVSSQLSAFSYRPEQ